MRSALRRSARWASHHGRGHSPPPPPIARSPVAAPKALPLIPTPARAASTVAGGWQQPWQPGHQEQQRHHDQHHHKQQHHEQQHQEQEQHGPRLESAALFAAIAGAATAVAVVESKVDEEEGDAGGVKCARAFQREYRLFDGEHLGSGVAAQVFRGEDKRSREPVAIKVFRKCRNENEGKMLADMLSTEITLMNRVGRHRNVVGLRGHYTGTGQSIRCDDGTIEGSTDVLVLDLAEGGELFDLVASQGSLQEEEALVIVADLLKGLRHLHSRGVVHLDLKPENMLLAKPPGSVRAEQNHIKLGDFGVSQVLAPGCKATGAAGTVAYWAPEMVARTEWDHAVDMWAAGCLIYILLCGAHPFDLEGNASDLEVSTRVAKGDRSFEEDIYFKYLSPQARDLIKGLLEMDPEKRLTASQALQHEWLHHKATTPAFLDFNKGLQDHREEAKSTADKYKSFAPARRNLSTRRSTRFRGFNNLRKVRPKILAVLAGQRLALSSLPGGASRAVATSNGKGAPNAEVLESIGVLDRPEDIWETREIDTDVAEVYGDVFRTMDRDHSGKIDVGELRDMFEMLGQNVSDEDIARLMQDGDLTDDGELSFDEFICLVHRRLGRPTVAGCSQDQLRRTFDFFDQAGDGYITAKELHHMLTLMGESSVSLEDANAIVQYCDANGDGKIDFEEFQMLMKQLINYRDH